MYRSAICLSLLLAVNGWSQGSVKTSWTELEQKRAKLPGVYQEFEHGISFKTLTASQASKRVVAVNLAPGMWRETSLGGSGDRIRIFDRTDIFVMDDGGDEFVRIKQKPKRDLLPVPSPYNFGEIDWGKAKELSRQPCGFSRDDHECIFLQLPLKRNAEISNGVL